MGVGVTVTFSFPGCEEPSPSSSFAPVKPTPMMTSSPSLDLQTSITSTRPDKSGPVEVTDTIRMGTGTPTAVIRTGTTLPSLPTQTTPSNTVKPDVTKSSDVTKSAIMTSRRGVTPTTRAPADKTPSQGGSKDTLTPLHSSVTPVIFSVTPVQPATTELGASTTGNRGSRNFTPTQNQAVTSDDVTATEKTVTYKSSETAPLVTMDPPTGVPTRVITPSVSSWF